MISTSAALRPRVTTSVADVPAQATVPLPERARRALAAISGDRPLEELVVLAAAVAWTVGLAEHTNEVSLAVIGPAGPVAVAVELDDATTPAQLVVRLDGALRAAAARLPSTSPVRCWSVHSGSVTMRAPPRRCG
jgi:hypothetical protein